MVIIKVLKTKTSILKNLQKIFRKHFKENALLINKDEDVWSIYQKPFMCRIGYINWDWDWQPNSNFEIPLLKVESYNKIFTEIIRKLGSELTEYHFNLVIEEDF